MFRDEGVDAAHFKQKFQILKEKFEAREEVHLDSEYHRELKAYIARLYAQTCQGSSFGDREFSDIREAEMSRLNRLQKLKNGTSYKKEKHKARSANEDWG